MSARATATPSTGGRPLATSRGQLEHVAFDLFLRKGFEQTSVDDIAQAGGISRRTFFRYFATKNDVVWGDFDGALGELRRRMAALPGDRPMMAEIRDAVQEFNALDPAEEPWHRHRMTLILTVPALYANSALRFTQWRLVVAEYAARRLGRPTDDLGPTLVGYSALGASLAAYERWLADPSSRLNDLLDEAFRTLEAGLGIAGVSR